MKYLILIYSNPASRQIYEGLSDGQLAEGLGQYAELGKDLAEAGEMIVSEALAEPSAGRRVVARDGKPISSDGPYAEVKEHLAGFFLIECASMERAIEHAARIPEAAHGLVEVRPVRDSGVPRTW